MGERFKELTAKFRESSSKLGGSMSEKMSVVTEKMSMMGGKVKDLLQAPTPADKMVEEATSETLEGSDWARNLDLCDRINSEAISSHDFVRAIKRRMNHRNRRVQLHAINLLETTLKNCERMFADVAQEKVLEDMVKIIDDQTTPAPTREKLLTLIEQWGESTEELRFLPVFEETFRELKGRGVRFPNRNVESLAPIFTPPSRGGGMVGGLGTTTTGSAAASAAGGITAVGARGGAAVADERDAVRQEAWISREETLSVARNTAELMKDVLSTASAEDAFQNELTLNLASSCRESSAKVRQLIDLAGEDEVVMFEALGIHDELQSLLERYNALVASWAGSGGGAAGTAAQATAGVGNEQQQQQQQERAAAVATSTLPMIDLGGFGGGGGEDEEEGFDRSGEVGSLVRKNSGQRAGGGAIGSQGAVVEPRSSSQRMDGAALDEAAMADLDEMIFGKKAVGGPGTDTTRS